MKVALFSDTYKPDINGVVTSISILKKKLEEEGHSAITVTANKHPLKTEWEGSTLRIAGIQLKKFYEYKLGRVDPFVVKNLVANIDADIIHMHTEFAIGYLAKKIARKLNVPLIYTYHTMYEDYSHYLPFSRVIEKFKLDKQISKRLSLLGADACHGLIAPSEKAEKTLRRYGVKKEISIIPTGLELDRFENIDPNHEKIAKIREKYSLNGKFTLIFLGRVAQEKSLDQLLSYYHTLVKEVSGVRLLIVGSGPYMEATRELVNKRGLNSSVIFTGKISQSEVPFYYRAADLFVNASRSETQGLTYIEALASKLPVLVQEDSCLANTMKDEVNGFFFHNREEFVSKAKMVMAMTDEELTSFKERLPSSISSYNANIFCKNVLNVYQKVLNEFPKEESR